MEFEIRNLEYTGIYKKIWKNLNKISIFHKIVFNTDRINKIDRKATTN